MPQNATVLIAHGPYEACGHVDWRTSRLDGLKCMYMHLLIPRIITLLSLYYYVQYMYIRLSLKKNLYFFVSILSANAYYSTIRTNRKSS